MIRLMLLTVVALSPLDPCAFAQIKYKDYQDAYTQGAKHVRAGRLADAREPLEAAAELARTGREKLEAHRALLVPYRELPEIAPMQKAAEYVLANSEQAAEQSLTRTTLLAFINKRGKMADAINGYEEQLKKSPDDRVLLFILTEAHARYKNDPMRSADLGEKLIAVEAMLKVKPHVISHAEVARQMVLAGRYKDGAELFERLAPQDEAMEAWNLKEAAQAWLKGGDRPKALAAAKKSAAARPEKRSDQLAYFWRRALGDTFLSLGEAALAVPHYEEALKSTQIDGYLKETKARLAEARAAAGK